MYGVYLEKILHELPAGVSGWWWEEGLTLVPSAGLCTTVVWASWGEVGDTLPCREKMSRWGCGCVGVGVPGKMPGNTNELSDDKHTKQTRAHTKTSTVATVQRL